MTKFATKSTARSVFFSLLLLTLLLPLRIHAESADSAAVRPVQAAYTVEVGGARLINTYLTPLRYSGETYALHYERRQAMRFSPESWLMQLDFGLRYDHTVNPAGNASMLYGGVDFAWAMMHRWQLPKEITLGLGGEARADLGCLYLKRNGNNPAQAQAAITVGLAGYALWNTRIGRLPISVRYSAALPTVGAFFAPEFGELYYEISLGNRTGLAHCAWWGNYFNLRNLLTVDLHLGHTSLRLGYRCNILSSSANHITWRSVTHAAVIGISGQWISLDTRRKVKPIEL
jgi:hypothetical protein